MLSAHKRHDEDRFFQEAVQNVIADNIDTKVILTQIRRCSYQVGFKNFMEISAFEEIFHCFKRNIADVLAVQGWNYKNCLIFI